MSFKINNTLKDTIDMKSVYTTFIVCDSPDQLKYLHRKFMDLVLSTDEFLYADKDSIMTDDRHKYVFCFYSNYENLNHGIGMNQNKITGIIFESMMNSFINGGSKEWASI